jgi:ubiquinone/menaquinone biosynthesis C-methylase UbiE
MKKHLPFDQHVAEYEAWFKDHPYVFQSEVEALREMLPEGDQLTGIEVGVGTGRFSQALGIKEGIEPSIPMRKEAIKRGIEIMDGVAEELPYADMRFDFVLMAFCICNFDELLPPFKEAFRVLKKEGDLIVGFLDKNSPIGLEYEKKKSESIFYKNATFYSVDKVLHELKLAGFRYFRVAQTLFHPIAEIQEVEQAQPGHGEGSFVVIKASKKPKTRIMRTGQF